MILHRHLGFMLKCIKENSLFCKCVITYLQMSVLRLNYLFNDASYVFVLINGKQFNHEMLLDQDFEHSNKTLAYFTEKNPKLHLLTF